MRVYSIQCYNIHILVVYNIQYSITVCMCICICKGLFQDKYISNDYDDDNDDYDNR